MHIMCEVFGEVFKYVRTMDIIVILWINELKIKIYLKEIKERKFVTQESLENSWDSFICFMFPSL